LNDDDDDDDDDIVPGILSTTNASRTHPKTLNNIRQKRARNWTKFGSTSIFTSVHGNKMKRQRNDRIIGPVKVLGTTSVMLKKKKDWFIK
jgi:hypothetical protein